MNSLSPASRSVVRIATIVIAKAPCGAFMGVACALASWVGAWDAAAAREGTTALPQPLLVWPAEHPANDGPAPEIPESLEWVAGVPAQPRMYPYLPAAETATGAAVLVCPGGGYAGQALLKEGIEVAQWLNERGIAAFVLLYRAGGEAARQPGPLHDAERSLRLIRSRAAEWRLDPGKIGVWGFSAGGHLASSLATKFSPGDPDADDPLERLSSRPDFAVLVYPVISMRTGVTHGGSRGNLLGPEPSEELAAAWSTDEQVTAETPPTFLVHASDDCAVVPQNSLRFYDALQRHGVTATLHVFAEGGHGFGMLRGQRPADQWPELLEPWLRSRGLTD